MHGHGIGGRGNNPTLIRVLEIGFSPDGNFRFDGGIPCPFVEVDWFHDASSLDNGYPMTISTEEGRQLLAGYIQRKGYFDPNKAYLVLSALGSFTINYHGG